MKTADPNGDGQLDYKELLAVIKVERVKEVKPVEAKMTREEKRVSDAAKVR